MKIQYVTIAVSVAVFLVACGSSEQPQPTAIGELPSTAAPMPDPSAQHIVVETSGVVELNRRSWKVSHYEPLQFGTVVRWGDLLRTGSDGEATIVCADLEMTEVSSDFMGVLPCSQNRPVLVYEYEIVIGVRSTDAPQIPFVISPRKTKLLNDRPSLRWNGVEGATSYAVTLLGDGSAVWRKRRVTGMEMAYPADDDPLQPGVNYILLVEADNGTKSEDEKAKGLGFALLEPAEAVRAKTQRLKDLRLSPEAQAYVLAQLYANPSHGLLAEAIDLLEKLTAQGCQESAVYRSLGEWYYAIGLVRLAEERFSKAEKLARDAESRSAAQIGLGEVYASLGNTAEAKKWFEKAQVGYAELGHISQVEEIERHLTNLRSSSMPPPAAPSALADTPTRMPLLAATSEPPTPIATPLPPTDPPALPMAAPSGSGRIAFSSDRDGNDEIYVMNADGSGVTNLTNNPADDLYPSWSPDGRRISFSSTRDDPDPQNCSWGECKYEIYVVGADGSGQTNLTNNPASDGGPRHVDRPSWSPDGTRIVFVSGRDDGADIYVMNADGTGATNLTKELPAAVAPSWSPDGTRIAFMSYYEIYVMNADGSGHTNLTNNPGNDGLPSWSPDGTRIAFMSTRNLVMEIYVINTDGSGQTNLTNNPTWDTSPSWSPDSTRIAFVSYRDGNAEIYVMNADGGGQTNLTNNPADDYAPSWSPDGTRIAFTSKRDGNEEIYLMNADGSGQTNLTNNPGNDWEPSWSPR